jgi:paraquat-inducible protein B
MSEDIQGPVAPQRTRAKMLRSWWPGWIWAVPIAALLVVGWLSVRVLAHPGETVQVLFDTAAGVQEGQTRVSYKGLDIGFVHKVALAHDHRHVEMTLRLTPDVGPLLRTGTRFWIVGAKPSLTDFSSLKSVFSGTSLEMLAGAGDPTRHFVGFDQAPVVPPGTQGTHFLLFARDLGSVQEGSPIFYHGLTAGRVVSFILDGRDQIRVDAFVQAPYDRFVRPGTQFWLPSPVQISSGVEGFSAQVSSPQSFVTGAVAFETPAEAYSSPPSPPATQFQLYADRDRAQSAPIGPQVQYRLDFDEPVGGLQVGAPVMMRGFDIGEVTQVGMNFDVATGKLSTPITVALEPVRLHLKNAKAPSDGDWTPVVNDVLTKLILKGVRARMSQSPPLLGARAISLDVVKSAPPARLTRVDGMLVIPTSSSGGLEDITAKADQILNKVNAIPITEIGADVRQITSQLKGLTGSPQLKDGLNHLDSLLANVDQIVAQAKPQVMPLIQDLRSAADQVQATATSAQGLLGDGVARQDSDLPSAIHQLNEAARSIRSLADYLERHPESLIKGKSGAKK